MSNVQKSYEILNPYIPTGQYRAGLQIALSKILPCLTSKEKEDLVCRKLMVDQPKPDESKYIQSAAELTVCAWFANVAGQAGGEFNFEPVINPPKDVDCSIIHEGNSV